MLKPSPSAASFDFFPLRFRFSALDPFHFPDLLSSNIFRGAFGLTLRALYPAHYAQLFSPSTPTNSPSGFRHCPRPFVFRARHLDGLCISRGEAFEIGFHLFVPENPPIFALIDTFDELARAGFGPQRSRALLISKDESPAPLSLPFASPQREVSRIRVDFLSPTELKESGELAERPIFGTLFRRSRDRISTLRALYGLGPLNIDFRAMSARADAIRLTSCEIRQIKAARRSSRTGQTHPLGGFTGFAEYNGSLAEFLPYLEIAKWTGVGRQTIWGKGEIGVRELL